MSTGEAKENGVIEDEKVQCISKRKPRTMIN